MGLSRETIDIERLLHWAYAIQKVDKQAGFTPRGPTASISGSIGEVLALGTRVDNSGAAAKALGVRTPDDAIIVHDAVMRLGGLWIEWRGDDEVEIWDGARAEGAGFVIERNGPDWFLRQAYVAGGTVEAHAARLEDAGVFAMVLCHARAGSRPDWYEGWVAPVGARARDGCKTDLRGRARRAQEGPSLREVMHARACYAAWHAALVWLVGELEGQLSKFSVAGPVAEVSPWGVKRGRVLTGCFAPELFVS